MSEFISGILYDVGPSYLAYRCTLGSKSASIQNQVNVRDISCFSDFVKFHTNWLQSQTAVRGELCRRWLHLRFQIEGTQKNFQGHLFFFISHLIMNNSFYQIPIIKCIQKYSDRQLLMSTEPRDKNNIYSCRGSQIPKFSSNFSLVFQRLSCNRFLSIL